MFPEIRHRTEGVHAEPVILLNKTAIWRMFMGRGFISHTQKDKAHVEKDCTSSSGQRTIRTMFSLRSEALPLTRSYDPNKTRLRLFPKGCFPDHRKTFSKPFRSSENSGKGPFMCLLGTLILSFAGSSWAATPFEETFDTDVSGWSGLNRTLRYDAAGFPFVRFPQLPIDLPESDAIQALSGASGGAFSGDYVDANTRLLGLDFIAMDTLPSEVLLRFSGTNGKVYFMSLANMITTTGVWHRLVFTLSGKNTGNWAGDPGADFETTLASVNKLEIAIQRSSLNLQRYGLDNVFTSPLPQVDEMQPSGGDIRLHWIFLRVGTEYTLEAAEEAGGTYTPIGSFTAASDEEDVVDTPPANAGRQVYRLSQ